MNTPTKHLPQGAAAAAAPSTSSRTHLVFGAPPTPSSDPSHNSTSASSSSSAAAAAAMTAAGLTPAPVTAAGIPSSPVSAIIDMLHDSARALFEYLRLTNALQPGSIAEADRAKVATIVQHLTVVFNAAEGNQEQALTAAAVRQLAKLNGISPQELDEYDQHMLIQAAGGAGAGMGMHNMSHDEADATGSHSGSDEMDNDTLAAATGTGKKKPGRKPGPKPKGALGAGGILNKPSFKSSPSSSSHASPSGGSTLGGDGTKKVRGPRTALIRWSDEEWSFLQQQVIDNGRNFAKIMSMHGPEGSLTQTLKRFEVKHLANKWANERAKRERSGLPRLPEKKLLGEEAVAADKAESAADAGDMSEIREFEGDADADAGEAVGMSSGATTPVSRGGGGGASALGLQAESGEDAQMSEAQDDEEDELMDDV